MADKKPQQKTPRSAPKKKQAIAAPKKPAPGKCFAKFLNIPRAVPAFSLKHSHKNELEEVSASFGISSRNLSLIHELLVGPAPDPYPLDTQFSNSWKPCRSRVKVGTVV